MYRRAKAVKRKAVHYRLIEPASEAGVAMYALLEDLVEHHHNPELLDARIALAWATAWRPDVDGRVVLGKLQKATDLARELAPYDLVVLLRQAFWTDPRVTDPQRRALLDHELCHATWRCDDQGAPLLDERGRYVYRTRKHDIEEFRCIVDRHGAWTADLERFARTLQEAAVAAYTGCGTCVQGWVSIEGKVGRCACWTAYQERRRAWTDEAQDGVLG